MKKFTPGPWKVESTYGNNPIYKVLAGGSEVCKIFTATMDLREDAEASAQLIAAAPDMYELLNEICESGCLLPEGIETKLTALLISLNQPPL